MEFSRILWVSQQAKDLWQPRISKICNAWSGVELKSIYAGYRDAAMQVDCWPNNPDGFVTIGLGVQARGQNYQAGSSKPNPGEPFSVRTVTIREEKVHNFIRAFHNGDDKSMGLMLGYPPCCIDFFNRTWAKGLIDPTEKMESPQSTVVPESNGLLRWIGVRPVSHMPCSTHCIPTAIQGRRNLGMLPPDEREWAYNLLEMNIDYTTLNGVAEISTPLFKIAASSQGTRSFRLIGDVPDGTVGGCQFPFMSDTWTHNGFIGPASMYRAHSTLLYLIPRKKVVLDFGCGNGRLLANIEGSQLIGIDSNVSAIIQGRKLHPNIRFIIGNMFEARVPSHDLSILSLNRLTETSKPSYLLDQLADEVIAYLYGEPLFEELLKTHFSEWDTLNESHSSHTQAVHLRRK